MSIRDWIGTDAGNVGDFDTAANWKGAAVPITGDTVRFLDASQAVTSGLDQGGKNFAEILFGGSAPIGSSASYLLCGATKVSFASGEADVFLDSTTASFDYNDVVVDAPSNIGRLHIKRTIDDLQGKRGNFTHESGACTNMWIEAGPEGLLDVKMITSTCTLLVIMGSTFTMTGAGTVTALVGMGCNAIISEGTVTAIKNYGARIQYDSANTVTDTKLYGGMLDVSNDQRTKTFTNVETHAGSVADFVNGPNNVVISNAIVRVGGDINIGDGSFVSV